MTKLQAVLLFVFVLVLVAIAGLCVYFLARPNVQRNQSMGFSELIINRNPQFNLDFHGPKFVCLTIWFRPFMS